MLAGETSSLFIREKFFDKVCIDVVRTVECENKYHKDGKYEYRKLVVVGATITFDRGNAPLVWFKKCNVVTRYVEKPLLKAVDFTY